MLVRSLHNRMMICLLLAGIPLFSAAAQDEDQVAGISQFAAEIENIHTKLKLLESDREYDSNRLNALTQYERALAYLKEADNFARKSAVFMETLDVAPGQINVFNRNSPRIAHQDN